MKTTINQLAFDDAFRAHLRHDQFGYKALRVLFEYLSSYEEDTGEDIELDVVALCCEYAVDSVADIAVNYDIDIAGMDSDNARAAVLEYLNEYTVVCGECDDGIVYYKAF